MNKYIEEIGRKAKEASKKLLLLDAETKKNILIVAAGHDFTSV